jgi:Xaa-Pro aminopeptidase
MRIAIKYFLCIIILLCSVYPQDIFYDDDLLPPSFFKRNREEFMKKIGKDAIAIFYSGTSKVRSNDVKYKFRQDNNFFYLTGLNEPDAVLVLIPGGISRVVFKVVGKLTGKYYDPVLDTLKPRGKIREILFIRERDPVREIWSGRTLGVRGAIEKLGFEYAMSIDSFEQVMKTIIFSTGIKTVYFPVPVECVDGKIKDVIEAVRSIIKTRRGMIRFSDPSPIIARMRMYKKPEEIKLLKKAIDITVIAHRQVMMSCEPGMYEYELQALVEYIFTRLGAESPGFQPIVGSGENSVILHYNSNRRRIRDGDLIVVDIGAEYHNYTADITRTIPANGRFSPEQREIYEIVLRAQKEAIKEVKPGASFLAPHNRAVQVIADGLLKLGIIKDRSEVRKYFMHGTSHYLGLDVHDVGTYKTLEPGMVITVEPGIYIPEGSDCDPKYWNIGVRIEDDILVTEGGYEILSDGAPREIDEIEKLMKRRGLGNERIMD